MIAGACGGTDTASDRDRNLQTGGYGSNASGFAINRLGSVQLNQPMRLTSQEQADGSHLVLVESLRLQDQDVAARATVARVSADRTFDTTFGVDGLSTITADDLSITKLTLTKYGHVLMPIVTPDETSGGEAVDSVTGIRRLRASDGSVDTSFGVDGTFVLPEAIPASEFRAVTGGRGATFYIATAKRDGKASPIDTTEVALYGYNLPALMTSQKGEGLLTQYTPTLPDLPEGGGVIKQGAPFLRIEDDGTVSVLVLVTVTKCADAITSPCLQSVRRAISTQQMTSDGSPILRPAEESDGLLWIDANFVTNTTSRDSEIDAVAANPDLETDERLITLNDGLFRDELDLSGEFGPGIEHVIRTNATYSTLDEHVYGSPDGPAENLRGVGDVWFGAYSKRVFVPGGAGHLVGLSADAASDTSSLWIAEQNASSPTGFLPYGNYAMTFETSGNFQVTDDGAFLNVEKVGLTGQYDQGIWLSPVFNSRGVLKLDTAGVPLPEFVTDSGPGKSPLNGVTPNTGGGFWNPTLVASTNNEVMAVGITWAENPQEDSNKLVVQRFKPDSAGTFEKSGDEVRIDIGRSSLGSSDEGAAVADGKGNLYALVRAGMSVSVIKVSLEDEKIDTSYGSNGYAVLRDTAHPETTWINPRLYVNADGSVDVLNQEWVGAAADEDGLWPMRITARRIPSNGSVDLSTPPIVVTTDPTEVGCNCTKRAVDVQTAATAILDSSGLVVMSYLLESEEIMTDPETGEEYESNETYVRVVRFAANGTADTTFGKRGFGGVRFTDLAVGEPIPAAPKLGRLADGRLLLGVDFIEALSAELGSTGVFSAAIRLAPNGLPANFTPVAQPTSPDPLFGKIDLLPPPNSGGGGFLARADEAATSYVENAIAERALPPTDEKITNTDGVVRIVVAGTSADRTINVRWSIPESLAKGPTKFTVTAQPGGKTCTTATTSCSFKQLEAWTSYSFVVKTVSAAAGLPRDSLPSNPVKPVRVLKRGTSTPTSKLITPASSGKQTWKVGGGCKLSKDSKTFTASKDAGLCTLSLTTAKSGKTPKTTRVITVVVKAVAK